MALRGQYRNYTQGEKEILHQCPWVRNQNGVESAPPDHGRAPTELNEKQPGQLCHWYLSMCVWVWGRQLKTQLQTDYLKNQLASLRIWDGILFKAEFPYGSNCHCLQQNPVTLQRVKFLGGGDQTVVRPGAYLHLKCYRGIAVLLQRFSVDTTCADRRGAFVGIGSPPREVVARSKNSVYTRAMVGLPTLLRGVDFC